MKNSIKIALIATILLVTPLKSQATTFSDIDETSPYYIAITYLSEKDIIKGYPDGSFQPFNNINRAELLKIIMEGTKVNLTYPETNCFTDVPYTQWYAPYICTAKSLGYVNGYSDGSFKPENAINKVEAIKIIGEAYAWDLLTLPNIELFTDTPLNDWYIPYLKYAKNKNLLPESGGKYYPGNEVTRGSVSETIFRMLAITELNKEEFTSEVIEEISSQISSTNQSQTNATIISNINGIITDALTGTALESANITLYKENEDFISTTTSDKDGNFTIESTNESNYLMFSKDGYFTLKMPISEISDSSLHLSLSKTFTQIDPEDLRIILTWGDKNVDFDAHLLTPEGEEIFFMYRLTPDLKTMLDIDSTKNNGTETITIKELEQGTYEYFAHNYSGNNDFSSSNARVEIYDKNGLVKIYYAPTSTADTQEIWEVFTVNDKGEIIDLNQIGDCEILEKYSSICPIKTE